MTETEDRPQTPPLSVSASLDPTHSQRPFSPLTLDELGLHPPSTPGALLDIITPVSFGLHEDSVLATESLNEPLEDIDRPKDEASLYSQDRGRKHDASPTLSKVARGTDLSSTSSVSTTHNHESFLTSFLQSITGDSMLAEPQTSRRASPADDLPPAIDDMSKSISTTQSASSTFNNATSKKVNGPTSQSEPALSTDSQVSQETLNKNSSDAASQTISEIPMTDFHRLFQITPTARGFTNQHWATSTSSSSSRHSMFSRAENSLTKSAVLDTSLPSTKPSTTRPASSWTPLTPNRSEGCLITSTPLERITQAETVKLAAAAHESMPAHGATVSDPSKAKWSSDLSSLNFFPLPQAPPLQPEHRYPISILETDGHYETDLDTDRESDTSPSVSRSFIVTSRSAISGSSRFKRKSLDTTQCDRKPSMTAMGNYQSQDKPATSEAHSSGADGTLKVVPLSNVVRSRSFSSASRSPSGGHNVYTWPAGSVESLRAAHLARSHSIGAPDTTAHVSEAARLSSGQVAASTYKSDTASSTARDSSYDFTRQTLLDLIRRTNLGIANNASSSETSGATSSKNTSSSREAVSAPQVPSSSYSAPPFGSSSNVPADLQAHLQSWQHHRKRQKLFGEALNETSKDQTGSSSSITPSNCNGRSTLDNSASLNELSVEELPRSSTRSSIDEQDHKMRRQERYQRMLLQINEQMQIKMRMNMQKQKQKEAQDKVQHEGSTKRTGDSSKEVEFRKPGPPSKTSTARRMSLDLPSNPNRGCDSSKGTMNGSSRVRGSMIQEARSHGTRPGTPTPNANLSTVRSNENTFNAGGNQFPTASDVMYSAFSANPWSTFGDATFRNTKQGSGASSSSRWMAAQQDGSTSWRPVCAPQYDPSPSTAFLSNWQTHQSGFSEPSWHSSSSSAAPSTLRPRASTSPSRTTTASQDFPLESNSILAMERMLKHPNWRRDLNPSASMPTDLPSDGSSSYTPHYVDTTSFAISRAAASGSRTIVTSQKGIMDGSQPSDAATGKSGGNRPISPGAEVVFWAVKGEHSVKLVGTVDSMTDRAATIFVTSGSSKPNGTVVPGTDPSTSNSGLGDDDVQECYENVPFVNILAKDQASLLGLL